MAAYIVHVCIVCRIGTKQLNVTSDMTVLVHMPMSVQVAVPTTACH